MAKRKQVNCYCSAYEFPHRIGGGRCTGAEWALSFYMFDKSNCDTCNSFNDMDYGWDWGCDVADGRESFRCGECYLHCLHSGDDPGYPITIDEYYEINRE